MESISNNAKQRIPFIPSRSGMESNGRRPEQVDKRKEEKMIGWLFAIMGIPVAFLLLACGLEWVIEHD